MLGAFADYVEGLDGYREALENPHVFDALVAAYTGWLGPTRLVGPPASFNLASGWIWVPGGGG